MRKLINSMMICVLLSLSYLSANAQEVSSPESRWFVRVYDDADGDSQPDDGEEISGVDIQWGMIDGVTCSSVQDDDTFNHVFVFPSPFFTAAGTSCHFYLVGDGTLTVTNYSAKRTSIDSQSIVPDVWIKLPKKFNPMYMPIVLRAWSGQ